VHLVDNFHLKSRKKFIRSKFKMDSIETQLIRAGEKKKTSQPKLIQRRKACVSEMPNDHCLNWFFFLSKGGDYSGEVNYPVTPSSVVSSSLRGCVF